MTTTEQPTITIELSMEQAHILSWICENGSRLMMMQFDTLTEICHRKGQSYPNHDELRDIELHLKQIFSPELSSNAYWGIHSPEIDNRSRTLFDLYQSIRNVLSWYRSPLGGWTVNFDELHRTDMENDPPKVTINTDDPNYEIYLSFFKRLNRSINQMVDKMGWRNNEEQCNQWIEACKQFALHEYQHITTTNTPLPQDEYLTFFNQYIDEDGYVRGKEAIP